MIYRPHETNRDRTWGLDPPHVPAQVHNHLHNSIAALALIIPDAPFFFKRES